MNENSEIVNQIQGNEMPQEMAVPNQMITNANQSDQPQKGTKKKIIRRIVIGVVILIVALIISIIFANVINGNLIRRDPDPDIVNIKDMKLPEDFVLLDSTEEIAEDGYIFTDYEDFMAKTDEEDWQKVLAEDFRKNTYGVVSLTNHYCGGGVGVDSMATTGNVVTVKTWKVTSCGSCAPATYNYLIKIDKEIENPVIKVEEEVRHNGEDCSSRGVLKPMIYLYPEVETEVSVRLGKPELLTTVYPEYGSEWKVLAKPDGTLDDGKREYYGLYWEGSENDASVHEDGFVVAGEDSAEFLEEKLAILGLTEREANEFIVYWLPKLEANAYNYIRFETREEIDAYMPLEVAPSPDAVIRIIMDYLPLNEPIEVKEQELVTSERRGFVVVEWGGTRIGGGGTE